MQKPNPKQIQAQRTATLVMRKQERPFARDTARILNKYITTAIGDENFALREAQYYRELVYNLSSMYDKRIKHNCELFSKLKLQDKKEAQKFLEYKVDVNFTDAIARQYIAERGATQIKYITETTRKQVKDALSLSIESELVSGDIQPISAEKRLRQIKGLTPVRATLIAATEIHASAMFAGFETVDELQKAEGFEYYKAWVAAEDERTRPWHAEMNPDEFIPLHQTFDVPSDPPAQMMYPGDPNGGASNLCNCRCVVFEERKEYL